MSIGGGSNKSKSTSTTASESQDYGSEVWGAQSPYLQDLYNQANFATGQGNGNAQQFLFNANNLSGNATGALDASQSALARYTQPGQDPALSAYANNLGQQFQEQFMPALKGNAALAGGLGGSRQQIGAALGAQRFAQTLGDFTAQTFAGSQERGLAAAQAMGQNAQLYGQNAQTQTGLADFSRSMPWYGLNQYAGLLGMPVALDQGGWTSSNTNTNQKSGGWNASFGFGGG